MAIALQPRFPNAIVGADRETYVRDTVPIFGYSRNQEPDTLFDHRARRGA